MSGLPGQRGRQREKESALPLANYSHVMDSADTLALLLACLPRHVIVPIAKDFKPDLVIVSAGFDAVQVSHSRGSQLF